MTPGLPQDHPTITAPCWVDERQKVLSSSTLSAEIINVTLILAEMDAGIACPARGKTIHAYNSAGTRVIRARE